MVELFVLTEKENRIKLSQTFKEYVAYLKICLEKYLIFSVNYALKPHQNKTSIIDHSYYI